MDELEALKLELADVKKQLAIPQVFAKIRSPPKSDRLTSPAFRFLDLPRELRDAVYELCLVVGKCYVRYPSSLTAGDMRATEFHKRSPFRPIAVPWQKQLFRVCKLLGGEAREIFVNKNLFVLFPRPRINFPFDDLFRCPGPTKFLRRLSITLDVREDKNHHASALGHEALEMRKRGLPTAEIREILHSDARRLLVHQTWYTFLEDIWNAKLKLDYFQINLQNCYCPCGCERVVEEAFTNDGNSGTNYFNAILFLRELAPKVLDIIGTVDVNERDFLRQSLTREGVNLQFHGGWSGSAVLDEKEEVIDEREIDH